MLLLIVSLIAGCSRPPARPEVLTSSLGGLTALARIYPGYSEVEVVGRPIVRLDAVRVKQILLSDFSGKRCLAVLTDADESVTLYDIRSDGLHEIWSGVAQSLKPWRIRIGDVDGDGTDDLMVGVYKKAHFHPVMANRPFVYGWDGKAMYPKWLGSRLSRPFTDFVLADLGNGVRVVAVEKTKDRACELSVYRWDGFGLTGEWAGARAASLSDLQVTEDDAIRVRAGSSVREYVWSNNILQSREALR